MTYPSNAKIEEIADNHVQVMGPSFPFRMAEGGLIELPSYELELQIHQNAEDLSAEDWARRRILDTWRAAQAADQPAGGLPVTSSGEFDEDKVHQAWVAGLPAVRIEFFAFDSYVWHYYLALPERIVELQHPVNIEENVPYAKLQDDAHALLLGALRFGLQDDAHARDSARESRQDSNEPVSACDQRLGFCTSYPASWFFRIWDYSESESDVAVTSAEMDDGMAVGDGMWIGIEVEDAQADVPFEAWVASHVESPSGLEVRDVEQITIDGLPAIAQVEDHMNVIDTHPGYTESVYIDAGERRWRISALARTPETFERHRPGYVVVLQHFETPGPSSESANPSGRYLGFIKGIEDLSDGEAVLEVDVAHYFGGGVDEAGRAAVEDGVVEDANQLSNPQYIRNLDPTTIRFQLPAAAGVKLWGNGDEGEVELQPSSVKLLLSLFDGSGPEAQVWKRDAPYWITVDEGMVEQVTEQYTP